MSEMSEDFAAWNKIKQEKRASNREASTAMLKSAGIDFQIRNAGAHLLIKAGDMHVDFWPGTGLWKVLGSQHKHRGVQKLISYVHNMEMKKALP